MKIGVTGHRRKYFKTLEEYNNVQNKVFEYFGQFKGMDVEINVGGATGFDHFCALAALKYGYKINLYYPDGNEKSKLKRIHSKTFRFAHWDLVSDGTPNIALEQYRIFKSPLSEVKTVNIGAEARNCAIVDNSDYLVCFLIDGVQYSGTKYTVDYAKSKGMKIINLWEDNNI